MKMLTKLKASGFSLVEVIVTLVVASIMGTMLYTILGTSMTKSSAPIFRMQESLTLQQVMENFLTLYYEDYEYLHLLSKLQLAIAGGASGGNEGATLDNNLGKYKIVENHFIYFDESGQEHRETDPAKQNLLKVTIQNTASSETLTYVFHE